MPPDIQTAIYDGLGRRLQKVVTKSGNLSGTFTFYDADTQARSGVGSGDSPGMGGASPGGSSIVEIDNGSGDVMQQVYHGTRYIDEIVAMRLEQGYAVVYQAEADQGGRSKDWNTIATCDLAGRVLERVFTTPYGSPIIETASYFGDYDGDGDVDSTDDASLGSGQTCWGTPSGACRVFDFNGDGTLNSSDETILTAIENASSSSNHRHGNRTVSPIGMAMLHQGLLEDSEGKIFHNRLRGYIPNHCCFLERDHSSRRLYLSLNYAEGLNLYRYVKHNPINNLDPSGLDCIWNVLQTTLHETYQTDLITDNTQNIPCPVPQAGCRLTESEYLEPVGDPDVDDNSMWVDPDLVQNKCGECTIYKRNKKCETDDDSVEATTQLYYVFRECTYTPACPGSTCSQRDTSIFEGRLWHTIIQHFAQHNTLQCRCSADNLAMFR